MLVFLTSMFYIFVHVETIVSFILTILFLSTSFLYQGMHQPFLFIINWSNWLHL